jgi:hypothetical protein
MRPTGAYRSNARALELQMSVPEDELEQEEVQDENFTALAEIDDLKRHPGYQTMQKTRDDLIRQYRSGEFLRDAIKDPLVSDAALGQLLRAGWMAAEAYEREKSIEAIAAEAVEERKAKNRGQGRATQSKGDS